MPGRTLSSLALLTLVAGGALGQNYPYILRTFAGNFPLGDGGPATQALLLNPAAVASDSAGNIYVADVGNFRIRKFALNGTISTVAQLGVSVNDMKLGKDGSFYLTANGQVLKVSSAGAATVLAGNGTVGFSGDGGLAVNALVGNTGGIALDSAGNIYFADAARVREITLDGKIQTVAGTGVAGYDGDNKPAISAELYLPADLGFDNANNLYIADRFSYRIRRVTPAGTISTYAGNGNVGLPVNGPATATPLGVPYGLAVDGAGNVFVSDTSFELVLEIGTNGNLTQVAGTSTFGYSDGPANSTYLFGLGGIAPDGSGGLYIAETSSNRVRQLNSGSVHSIAGRLHYAGDGGPAVSALLNNAFDTAADAQGNVFILDSGNFRIRKVASDGTINTFAGTGLSGTPGEGVPAASAPLPQAYSMTIDGQGNLYIGTFKVIYKITAGGVISTFAGSRTAPFGSGDGGPATQAALDVVSALAADSAGNIYVGDCCLSRVRKISPDGTISAFAGTGTVGYTGDGGLATSATLSGTGPLATDAKGNVYIGDGGNNAVRMVTPGGIITTVAGNGSAGSPADGAPAKSPVNAATSLTVDAAGNLYIMSGNFNTYRVDPAGVIHIVSGSGTAPAADGSLANTTVGLNGSGTHVDANGDLLVAVPGAGVIRKLVFDAPSGIVIAGGNNQTGPVGTTLPNPLRVTVNGRGGVPVPGATVVFAVTSGDATLSARTSLTDGTGTAGIGVTFGSTPGAVNIAAAVEGTQFGTQFTVTSTAVNGIPTITLVANAFGDTPLIAPNTWVEIKGTNLAPAGDSRIWLGPDFVNSQLPAQLDGVSVTVNGKAAYVYFISPTQVNVLTPPDALSGPVQVQLTMGGVQSNIATVPAQSQSLSFFEFVSPAGLHYVYGRHAGDNSLIGPPGLFPAAPSITTPVKPGESIYVAGNGFGPTDVQVISGSLSQSGNLPQPFPVVKIGGIQAQVSFAGLIAVGTYQFNLTVPDNVPDGDQPLTATYEGLSIQPNLLITVQH